MSLSAEQVDYYHNKWWKLIDPILTELLIGSYNKGINRQISSTFGTAMCNLKLDIVLDELVEGDQIFIDEEWFVDTPSYLITEKKYFGDVIIDLAGGETPVRLEHFCFVAKIAAVFYAKHLVPDFDPWKYFIKIDQLCEKYSTNKNNKYT